jgi:uncharacterized protein YgiM (DUF1202 family)
MKRLTKKIMGLAIVASISTSLVPSAGILAASPDKSLTQYSVAATTYGWVCTQDGVGVNLRASQSTSSTILAKIPEGTKVTITSVLSNWYKVTYNGQTGYIARGYLIDEYGDAI